MWAAHRSNHRSSADKARDKISIDRLVEWAIGPAWRSSSKSRGQQRTRHIKLPRSGPSSNVPNLRSGTSWIANHQSRCGLGRRSQGLSTSFARSHTPHFLPRARRFCCPETSVLPFRDEAGSFQHAPHGGVVAANPFGDGPVRHVEFETATDDFDDVVETEPRGEFTVDESPSYFMPAQFD